MELTIHSSFDEQNQKWLVFVAGEIDIYNSDDFKEKLTHLLEEKMCDLLLDMSELKYIDSTGLGALVYLYKKTKQCKRNISIIGLRKNVEKIFRITELNKIFNIEGDHDG